MSGQFEQLRNQIKQNQIDALIGFPVGRILDKLIEKYTLGHIVEVWHVNGEEDFFYFPTKDMKKLSKEYAERIPNYSTSIYAASQLLEHLSNWYISKDETLGYQAKIIEIADINNRLPHFKTFPEAVVKACLYELILNHIIIDELTKRDTRS
ncbi:MAG: hypothetical protein RLZZ267_1390 [Bacillota bacterium]